MISRYGGSILALAALSTALACGTATSQLGNGSGALDGEEGGAEAGSSAVLEAGSGVDAGFQPGTVLYQTHFDAPEECARWKATGGDISTVPGNSGGSACMICATSSAPLMYMRNDVLAAGLVGPGKYEIDYLTIYTGPNSGGLRAVSGFSFDDMDGAPSGLDGTESVIFWSPGQSSHTLATARADEPLGVYLGAEQGSPSDNALAPGKCVVFDDLRVTYYPTRSP